MHLMLLNKVFNVRCSFSLQNDACTITCPKSFSRKLSDPNCVCKSKFFFDGKVMLLMLLVMMGSVPQFVVLLIHVPVNL